MKKRVLAALLALVMLFGALPMSVFAEDLETVEEPSGTFEPDEPEKYTYHLYYDFNYVGTGSTKWNIEYGPTADTSYTYTVDSQTLTCREGYNFLGWADGKNATEPDYRGGDTITLTWHLAESDQDHLCGLEGEDPAPARYHRPDGFCKDTVCSFAVQRQR